MLTVSQIQELLDIINKNGVMFIAKTIGPNYLTGAEIELLKSSGINPNAYYSLTSDLINTSFQFGLISDVIAQSEAKKMSFKDLKQALSKGKYIPLTMRERFTLESIKKQYLGDIKGHQGRIFSDINDIISVAEKNNRKAYENVIRDEVMTGTLEGKSTNEISREIAHKTGDWSRNFGRIVEFMSHQAFDEGRAALYERMNGEDALVFKHVYNDACMHCIRLYLTAGLGSQPIIFKLSKLRENGSNIGRKTSDWLAVVGSTHPHCRCTLHDYDSDYQWNNKTQMFDIPKERESKRKREKIKVVFNEKEYFV